jgi:hypothetical protein
MGHLVLTILSVFLGTNASYATNFRLSDFVDIDSGVVVKLTPQLIDIYPRAKFRLSGFTTQDGEWKFVRVEDPAACEGQYCLTVVKFSEAEWSLSILAETQVEVSINHTDGTWCNLKTPNDIAVSVRYHPETRNIAVISSKK